MCWAVGRKIYIVLYYNIRYMVKPIGHKKYLKLYEETAKNRILEVLFRFPDKEFSLSDLAKEAEVAKANIGKILDEFEYFELIQIERLTKIWRIRANRSNWFFKRSKIVYNLNFVYQHNLAGFLSDNFNNPKSITLFGSFRWGEDISNSDIDIAIESDDFEEYKVIRVKKLKSLKI